MQDIDMLTLEDFGYTQVGTPVEWHELVVVKREEHMEEWNMRSKLHTVIRDGE